MSKMSHEATRNPENDDGSSRGGTTVESVSIRLDRVIAELPPGQVTVSAIRDLIGDEGVLLLCMLLCIIFMVPVSIPGVSTVFGAAILLSGVSRLFHRKLWLPGKIARQLLPADKVKAGLQKGSKWLHRMERVSKPYRLHRLVATAAMETLSNLAIILGAVLLMAPFGFVPFSNTLPALALMFLCIGMLQRDGLCILFGHLTNLATMIYFAVLVLGGTAAVQKLWQYCFG